MLLQILLVKRIKLVSDINLNITVLCTFDLLEIPLSTNITVLCTYASYPANYPQFVQCTSFSGKLQSSALHLCRLSLQIIHSLFSALRFQENYKAVLCTCAGSHYKLSTICSVLFVFRKITKQCSALVPALITNYLQFVYCSSFSGKLQSSALHLCWLPCKLSTIC